MTSLVTRPTALAAMFVAIGAAAALAQQPATPAAKPLPGSAAFAPDTNAIAPDFSLPGATRFGLLRDPVKLSDYRGQTVVLAFFPKARTKG